MKPFIHQRDVFGGCLPDVRPDLLRPDQWRLASGMKTNSNHLLQRRRRRAQQQVADPATILPPVGPGGPVTPGGPLPPSLPLADVHFIIRYDTSGSMNDDIPNIQTVATAITDYLTANVYDNDPVQAAQYVDSQGSSSERWLQFLAATSPGEQSTKYINIVFINESISVYHNNPRQLNEPKSAFTSDLALLDTEFQRRELSRGKVYPINPGVGDVWYDDYLEFDQHLAEAVGQTGQYTGISPSLASLNIQKSVGVLSGTSSLFFLQDIATTLLQEV